MYIRPNPKLRIFYVVMIAPLAAAAGVIYLVYQTLQPQYHYLLGRNLFLGALLTGTGVVSWHISLDLARTLKQFFEAYQAVSRGELILQTDTSGMAEIRQLAAAFNQMHESLDTSFSHWVLASRENHRIFLGLVRAISGEMDSKDFYMRGHVGRVACYATWIAEEIGVPPAQVERIRFSALLHDIGKIGLDDRILAKTGVLTEEEFEIMKSHPLRGAEMLRPIAELADVVPGVELHHESLDGRGYPYGLKGEDIPLMARIIAVADAFDAMTMHRPYQAAMDAEHVLRVLRRLSATKFDPWVVEAISRVYASGRIHLPSTEDAVDEEARDTLVSA